MSMTLQLRLIGPGLVKGLTSMLNFHRIKIGELLEFILQFLNFSLIHLLVK